MSRLATLGRLMLATLLASAEAHATAPLEDPPGVLALRVAHLGTVDDCAACILVELQEDAGRAAYFVHPTPDCHLDPSEVSIVQSGHAAAGSFVEIEYPASARDRIRRCLRVHGTRVMASIDGEPLGVAFFGEPLRLYFVAGRSIVEMPDLLSGVSQHEVYVKEVRLSGDPEGPDRPVVLVAPEGREGILWRVEARLRDAPILQQGGSLELTLSAVSKDGERVFFRVNARTAATYGSNHYQMEQSVSPGDRILFACRSLLAPGQRGPSGGCDVDLAVTLRLREADPGA